jgi:hypothetical protein
MNIHIQKTGSVSPKYWKNILVISILTICFSVHSQMVITGSSVKIVCSGAPQIVLNNISYKNESSSNHFVGANSIVNLIGSTATNFSSTAGYTTQVANMVMNKPTSNVTLAEPVSVTGTLTMTTGDFFTDATNVLTLGVASPGTMSWTAGTVVGPMKRWMNANANTGNASSLFPVGNKPSATVINRWSKLEFGTAPTAAGYLTVEFKGMNPTSTSAGSNGIILTDQYNWQLDNVASEGYWEILPAGLVGGNYNLTVRANQFASVFDYSVARIIKSPVPNNSWVLDGTHGTITGNSGDFSINRTGISGYSYFAIGYPTAAPLPIELLNFQANCAGEGRVNVTWATASEHNSANFTVEKSRDGMNWTVLASVAGAGNSTQIINYSTVDNNAAAGVNYYRLTQTDFDGATETFNIASANCDDNSTLTVIKVYPNPSSGDFYIDFTSEEITGEGLITLTDARGSQVYVKEVIIEEGSNVFHVDLDAAPGMYYIRVSNKTQASSIVKHSLR